MAKPNRNDPCPCGSGRKYKNCCEQKGTRKNFLMGMAIGLLIVLGIVLASRNFTRLGDGERPPDCPPGQVWSAEHGHCH